MNYWYLALIGLGLILIILILFKDQILNASRYLGRGEFSEAFLTDKGMVLKKSALNSLYNPDPKIEDKYLKRNIQMLKSEVKTYNKLKKGNYSIIPKKLYSYTEKDTGKYVIVKEHGEIPIADNSRTFLPKWKTRSVKQEKYDKFAKELYQIAKYEGHFEDQIQPALRSNGDLFLIDLGLFVSYEDEIKNDRIVKKSDKTKITDYDRTKKYRDVNDQLEHLDSQLGIEHKVPDFVIKENLNYWNKEFDERKQSFNIKFAEKTAGKQIEFWESKK